LPDDERVRGVGGYLHAVVQTVAHNPADLFLIAEQRHPAAFLAGDLEVDEKILQLLGSSQSEGAETIAWFPGSQAKRPFEEVGVQPDGGVVGIGGRRRGGGGGSVFDGQGKSQSGELIGTGCRNEWQEGLGGGGRDLPGFGGENQKRPFERCPEAVGQLERAPRRRALQQSAECLEMSAIDPLKISLQSLDGQSQQTPLECRVLSAQELTVERQAG
jgi:hypothetical protein